MTSLRHHPLLHGPWPARLLLIGVYGGTAITVVTSFYLYDSATLSPAAWMLPSTFLGPATLSWISGRLRPRRTVAIVGVGSAYFGAVGLLLGFAPLAVLRMIVVNQVAVFAMLLVYRRGNQSPSWFPDGPRAVLRLLGVVVAGSAFCVLAGGTPYFWLDGGTAAPLTLAWIVRIATNLWFGAVVITTLFYPPTPMYSRLEYRPYLPIIVPFSLACLVTPFLLPRHPLHWVVFVAAVWVGLTATPRFVGITAVAMACIPMFFAESPLWAFNIHQWMSPSTTMELMLSSAVTLCFLMVAYRERRARLTAEVSEAADREAAEAELLRSVVESMSDGVLLTDARGRIVISNPAARALLGHPTSTRSGRAWAHSYRFHDPHGAPLTGEDIDQLITPPVDDFTRITVAIPSTDESLTRYCSVTARGMAHRQNRLNLVMISDVTSEFARSRELESFAGTVAHDLKNPLASLSLWMDIADEELEADQEADLDAGQHALEQALEACRRMGTMIDEYLAYTVTREGVLRAEPVPIEDVVREATSMYGTGEAAPTIEVQVYGSVLADHALTTQLLSNLIGNAIKYARPDEPPYVLVRNETDADPGWLRIFVADKGLGITAEEAEEIFKPFARSAKGTANGQGIGLGLALCHAIVARHGGEICAYPNDWGGATFEFTLPRAESLAV